MDNILKVTEHIKKKLLESNGTYDRRVLSFMVGKDGKPYYYTNSTKHFWRVYEYIGLAVAYNMVEKPEQFYEAGRSFGEFQRWLSDFPAQTLAEIIPNFHNTPVRFRTFREAVERDTANRRAEVEEEIRFLLAREAECGALVDGLASGEIPYRVTHNDTKINNILFDIPTQKAICVIDLDTVMPGSSLYDFGDAVRFAANTAAEDEKDLSKVSLDMNRFRAFAEGFVPPIASSLTDLEIDTLALGAFVITVELAVRFLDDYITGDQYFKTEYHKHNLVRARCQLKLAKDIMNKYDELTWIVRDVVQNG
jgi:hypothetical protein